MEAAAGWYDSPMGTGLPTKFLWSRALASVTAGLMLGILVLVASSVAGLFDHDALPARVRWEPLRLWAFAWCAASGLYALLTGALAREIARVSPDAAMPPGRAMLVAGLPVVNVMLLPGLFDEGARFVGERLSDPVLDQRLRYLARGPASVAVGGLIGLLLLGIVLPGLFPKDAATAGLAALSLVWLLLPPLFRLWHMVVLRRALADVVVRETAARARARYALPAAG